MRTGFAVQEGEPEPYPGGCSLKHFLVSFLLRSPSQSDFYRLTCTSLLLFFTSLFALGLWQQANSVTAYLITATSFIKIPEQVLLPPILY